jgi:hypothetical protein
MPQSQPLRPKFGMPSLHGYDSVLHDSTAQVTGANKVKNITNIMSKKWQKQHFISERAICLVKHRPFPLLDPHTHYKPTGILNVKEKFTRHPRQPRR